MLMFFKFNGRYKVQSELPKYNMQFAHYAKISDSFYTASEPVYFTPRTIAWRNCNKFHFLQL